MKRIIPLLLLFAGFQANATIMTYTGNANANGNYITAMAVVTSTSQGVRDYPGLGLDEVEFKLFDSNNALLWLSGTNGPTIDSPTNFIEFDAAHAVIDWSLRVEFCGSFGNFQSSPTRDVFQGFGGCSGIITAPIDNNPGSWASDGAPASVPEPSIIALFAAGIFGIGFARRRQS